MTPFFLIIIFLFGLIMGSFLNSVIYRLEEDMPVLRWQNRSMCPHCKKTLTAGELVPLLSFIIQRGRCQGCGEKISLQYPLVELGTGILYALSARFILFPLLSTTPEPLSEILPYTLDLVYLFTVGALLVLIFVFDYKYYIIPNQFMYPLIVLSLGYGILNIYHTDSYGVSRIGETIASSMYIGDSRLTLLDSTFGSTLFITLLITGFFLALVLVSQGKWMGMGDVKYAIFMGLFLGWPHAFTAFTLSFLLGAIISLILMSLKKKNMRSEIPFGPFLILGTLLALFWGDFFNSLLF